MHPSQSFNWHTDYIIPTPKQLQPALRATMAALTHPEFHHDTEGVEVAKAFADGIHGKTILITGANLEGIGFSTAQALVRHHPTLLLIANLTPLLSLRNLPPVSSSPAAARTRSKPALMPSRLSIPTSTTAA
jgi:hypothetical protein